jgi:hypothetical protein
LATLHSRLAKHSATSYFPAQKWSVKPFRSSGRGEGTLQDRTISCPETFLMIHVICLLTGKTDKHILILSYA